MEGYPTQTRFSTPITDCRNSHDGNGVATHQETFAHTLPTVQAENKDLAFIMEVWDRLADECKRVLIEMVRSDLTVKGGVDELHEVDELGE